MKRAGIMAAAWALSACVGETLLLETDQQTGEALLANGQGADGIFGQRSVRGVRAAQTNAGSLDSPSGVATSPAQSGTGQVQLFIADTANARVLGFRDARTSSLQNGGAADLVVNQSDMFTIDHRHVPTAPISQAFAPSGVAMDTSSTLYVYTSTRVVALENPFATDALADYALLDLPTDVRHVRPLSRGRIAVVGSSEVRFYPQGDAAPLHQSTLASPCGAALTDVAELTNFMLVACSTAVDCADIVDPADCNDTTGVAGACGQATCGGVYVYALDSLGLPDATVAAQVAYRGLWNPTALALKSDRLFIVERDANRSVRFSGVESHVASRLSAPTTTSALTPFIGGLPGNTSADGCYGQASPRHRVANFVASAPPRVSEGGLTAPVDLVVDAGNGAWVVDSGNHRVLHFANALDVSPGKSADLVVGQPDAAHAFANRLEGSAFALPVSLAVRHSGTSERLFVADRSAHRVMAFDNPASLADAAAATLFLGQPNELGYLPNAGNTALSGAGFRSPGHVHVDASGGVFVTDEVNARVLRFTDLTQGAGADAVYGVTNMATAGTLESLGPVAVKGSRVYVGGGNRILVFSAASSATPSRILGQPQGDTTSNTCNRGGSVGPDTLCDVKGLAFDSQGSLWVSDSGNHRVLRFDSPEADDNVVEAVTADGVVGQVDLRTAFQRAGALTDRFRLTSPYDLSVDAHDRLWVADNGSNRVLLFPTPRELDATAAMPGASLVLGQPTFTGTGANSGPVGVSGQTMRNPADVAVNATGDVIYVADQGNRRVLRFSDIAPLEFVQGGGTFQVRTGATLSLDLKLSKTGAQLALEGNPSSVQLAGNVVTIDARTLAVGTSLRFGAVATLAGPPAQVASTSFLIQVVSSGTDFQRGRAPAERSSEYDDSCACSSRSPSSAMALLLGAALLVARRQRRARVLAEPHT